VLLRKLCGTLSALSCFRMACIRWPDEATSQRSPSADFEDFGDHGSYV